MPAAARPLLSAQVYRQLLGDILAGRLAPGDAVPSERALHQELGVNRHAVREALKRLQQAGLIEVRQGGPTRVCDFRRTAGLDLMPLLATEVADLGGLTGQVAEMRHAIGADAAARCAARAPEDVRERLAAVLEAPPAGSETADGRRGAYAVMWEAIVDGAQNLPYRLAFNSLVASMAAIGEPAFIPFDPETADTRGQRALLRAILDGDQAAARRAADALLSQGERAAEDG